MSYIQWGCGCPACSKLFDDRLEKARQEWKSGTRKIELKTFYREGAIVESGTEIAINGVTLNWCQGDESWITIPILCEFLGIDNVEVECTDEDDMEQ